MSKKDILRTHMRVYQRPISDAKLRQEIIPMLENAALIEVFPDPSDKRRVLILPLHGTSEDDTKEIVKGGRGQGNDDPFSSLFEDVKP